MRQSFLIAACGICLAAPVLAQAPESNLYLPINSWATPYVEHLIRAGVLEGLLSSNRRGVRGDRWVWRVRAEIRRRSTGGIHWTD